MAFTDEDYLPYLIMNRVADVIFICELVVNFFIAYYDKSKVLISNYKDIRINYLTGWFLFDLISSIPLSFINNNNFTNISRFIKIPKLFKFFRFPKLVKSFSVIKENIGYRNSKYNLIVNPAFERLFVTLISTFILMHILSCLWFMSIKWYPNDNWIMEAGDYWESRNNQYLACFYWVVQTSFTVGYGEFPAINAYEKTISIISMFIGVFIYSFLVGSISSIFFSIDEYKTKINKQIDILNILKHRYKIDNNLFNSIRKTIYYNAYNTDMLNELRNDLPYKVKLDLNYEIFDYKLRFISYFKNKSKEFIATIGPLLTQTSVKAERVIFEKDDQADEIYFLNKGSVSLYTVNDLELYTFYNGNFFGEWDILFNQSVRTYTCRAITNCEFLILKKNNFENVFFKNFIKEKQLLIQKSYTRYKKFQELNKLINLNSQRATFSRRISKYKGGKHQKNIWLKAKEELKKRGYLKDGVFTRLRAHTDAIASTNKTIFKYIHRYLNLFNHKKSKQKNTPIITKTKAPNINY